MSLTQRILVIAVVAGWAWPNAAESATISYDFTGADHGSLDWTLNGAAYVIDGGVGGLGYDPDRLRITSNGGGQNNSAWLNQGAFTFFRFADAWSASMRGQMTFHAGGGADGMGMHFQSDGLAANPNFEGAGLTGNRLSINVDTWQNAGEGFTNSMEIWLNGTQLGAVDLGNTWEAGANVDRPFDITAAYDGVGTLSVSFDVIGDAPGPIGPFTYAADLSTFTTGYWGFSASTGGAAANHDVLTASITATIVPEPSSGALLLCGGLGIFGGFRRRR